MRRVVVTGLGAVTPLGNDARSTWEAALAGRSGIDWIRSFDASDFPCASPRRSRTSTARRVVPPKEARRLERNVAARGRRSAGGGRRRGARRVRSGARRDRPRLGDRRRDGHPRAGGRDARARRRPRVAVLPAERPRRLGERPGRDHARDPRPELRRRLRVRDRLARGRRGRGADQARRRRRRSSPAAPRRACTR